jgi:hypothetical protein
MAEDLGVELAELDRLSVARLLLRYEALFGQAARSTHRAFLVRRIAWKLQERRHGPLSHRASQRLAELAELLNPLAAASARARRRRSSGEARDPRGAKPNRRRPREIRLPKAGDLIRRVYKGREIVVRVLDRAFEYDGQRFRSLSAIAKAVTGAHWNGLLFFGLVTQKK